VLDGDAGGKEGYKAAPQCGPQGLEKGRPPPTLPLSLRPFHGLHSEEEEVQGWETAEAEGSRSEGYKAVAEAQPDRRGDG
jgi:hypothetical protein